MEPKFSPFHYSSFVCPEPDHSSLLLPILFKSHSHITCGSVSFRFPHLNSVCISFFPHTCHISRPSHNPCLNCHGEKCKTWSSVCSFLYSYVTFLRLGPNILLSTLFWNTFSPCSSSNLRNQISHVCKTSKLILPCILIFVCLGRKREGKRFWNKWWQAFLQFHRLLMSSWMQLSLVSTVVPCVLTLP
jgi:hypothetical protein